MTTSRIVALAKEIETNTIKLDEYLEKNDLPRPSFDADAPLMYQLPPDIAAAQEALTTALDELYWLNQGPIQTVVAKSVSTSLGASQTLKRVLTLTVCYFGWPQDDPSLQHPVSCSTRLRCHFSGACGQDWASGKEADKTVEAWNDGSPFSRVGARLCETYGRNESARCGPFTGAMVPHGYERGWTRQDACKLPNNNGCRANQL